VPSWSSRSPLWFERRRGPSKTGTGRKWAYTAFIQTTSRSVTALLLAWREGDETALARLTPLVHQELQHMARRCLRGERAGHTLQATALVNEAYLRLLDVQHATGRVGAHFLAMAARHILIEFARARGREKRGGGALQVSGPLTTDKGQDLVALDDALEALAKMDERQSRVVELRLSGGLSVEETANVLAVSPERSCGIGSPRRPR
jgi:RNA polymerase sigma factor (TIGR02999 family)